MKRNLFAAIGRVTARQRWRVLLVTVLFVILAGIWGSGAFGRMTGGAGFDDPGSESSKADVILEGPLDRYVSDVVVLYEHPQMTVEDPAFADSVRRAVSSVPANAVVRMESYWSTKDEAFVSHDRHATYVTVQLPSSDEQERVRQFKEIKSLFQAEGLTVRFGGLTPMTEQVNALTGRDIAIAESLSMPLLLVMLVLIFRSAVAASLPLLVGIVVAVGSFAVLRSLTSVIDISSFSINVITMLGLGLAIDYALFIVSRFREELSRGRTVDEAIEHTMATAGRTVAFSGITVAVSLACLVVFPSRFLSSMGFSGMATVLFAVLGTLLLLPALLRFAGHRINQLRVPIPKFRKERAAYSPQTNAHGRWYRTAHAMMRRPILSTLAIVLLLLGLGSPFVGVNWARPGDWVLPMDADARAVTEKLRTEFDKDPAKIMTAVVTMPEPADSLNARTALQHYTEQLPRIEGVYNAVLTGTEGHTARLTIGYSVDPQSREAYRMVEQLRAVAPPTGAEALLTGMPASRVDIVNMIASRLPWMIAFVSIVSFIILFMAFGSIVLPIKSIIMNLLSLSASFGAIKLIFQDGYLAQALHFVPVGAVDVNFPVLIVAIAFGLSMDYEVFLLSRIREEWVSSRNIKESIALGVQHTAGIISSAAVLLLIVVGGFMLSSITFMKMIGVGLVIAIIVDATIVRGLLVPATMRLLGKWAWWSPAPVSKWWERYGLKEGESSPTESPGFSVHVERFK